MSRSTPPVGPRNPLFPPEVAAVAARTPPPGLLPVLGLGAAGAAPWSAQAVLVLVEAWCATGRPAILADLGLEDPHLHELVEVPNAEGIVDVFLFGTSLAHATQQPQGRAFRFVPAGLFAPDPREVVEHPKWTRLGHEMQSSRTTLIVYLTDRTPGFEKLLRRAGQVVVLVGDDAPIAASPVPAGCEVLAVIRQPTAGTDDSHRRRWRRAAEPAATEPEPGSGALRPIELSEEAVEPHAPAGQVPDWRASPPVIAPISRGRWLEEPPPPDRPTARRRRIWPGVVAGLLLAVAAGAALWYFQPWSPAPVVGLADGPAGELEPVAPPEPRPPPEPRDVPVPYSVAVEAHLSLPAAHERVRQLRAAEPGVVFAIAPTPLDDLVWYRIVAGPAADSTGAAALMQQLYSRGHKTSLDPWAIRLTHWAFLIADFPSRREAEERAARLEEQQIPAYIVEMPMSEGPPRHRVYAGAFEGLTEADYMRDLLQRAGVRPQLIRRTGRPIE
jgi:hypothetical protein